MSILHLKGFGAHLNYADYRTRALADDLIAWVRGVNLLVNAASFY